MRVYGDGPRAADPCDVIAGLRATLAAVPALPAGIERHAGLVAALIAAGELAQGIADADFAASGADASSPTQDAAMALLMGLARAVIASWDSGFRDQPPVHASDLDRLEALKLPERVTIKRPEGYAFYALYPEAYAEAAKALAPSPDTCVIGLRSIGTGLAAMVAARLGATAPTTLRPIGNPFRRELKLSPALQQTVRVAESFAVVDEGPGLSGSSFGAIADWLEAEGASPKRIVLFPSHIGDLGPEADEAHRRRWKRARRLCIGFDDLVLAASEPEHRLESWVADLTGEAATSLEDISGGAWRARLYASEADWPPVNSFQEARKFRLRTERGLSRLKFVGLDAQAPHKLSRAQALAAAGFGPEVVGLRHGFMIEREIDGAKPLDLASFPRERLIKCMGDYLSFRASSFPTAGDRGASFSELLEMGRINAGEALGARAVSALDRWTDHLPKLERRVRRVETDNRIHVWEWLVAPDGRLFKTDAVDHAHAHDLIGCQDIAWDVAGAAVELGLNDCETDSLLATVGGAPELLDFLLPCYLAFQLGAYAMAAEAHTGWPEEQRRLSAQRDRYAVMLESRLDYR